MGISTHVLDTARGRPAAGVVVALELREGDGWRAIGGGTTDNDGRIKALVSDVPLRTGTYRATFDTGRYFAGQKVETFFPQAVIVFSVTDAGQHYHVPLLVSPFGYSTYRGT